MKKGDNIGDSFKGTVVFDFSYKKLKPEEAEKHMIKAHQEHPELKYPMNKIDVMITEFGRVKTLGDIQDYIVKFSVYYGHHPSNPWMDEAKNGFLGGVWEQIMNKAEKKKSDAKNGVLMKKAESCDDPKKERGSAEEAVEKLEADEKKQRLKEKIREKRLKRQGK